MDSMTPPPTVWPSVSFTDVDAGIALLTEGLGFEITALYRDAAGVVEHAEARWPDGGGIMFGSRDRDSGWAKLGAQGVYIAAAEAATIDKAWERLRERPGVTVVQPLEDTDYGSHGFGVQDAEGNLWSLGTYRGA